MKKQQTTTRPLTGLEPPPFPPTHYVDNRIYTDPEIFEAGSESIFAKAWKFVLHESEIPHDGDYRTVTVAGRPLIVVRGDDGALHHAFFHCSTTTGGQTLR